MAKLKLQQEWKLWAGLGVVLLLIIAWLYFASRPPTEGGEALWKVTQVVDEKTLTIKGSGKTLNFQLIGLNNPSSQVSAVKDYLSKSLENKWVRIKPLKDLGPGQKLGFVYHDGEDIVARMVRQGLAEVDRTESAFDVRPYIELEQEARREKRGMWRQSDSGAK